MKYLIIFCLFMSFNKEAFSRTILTCKSDSVSIVDTMYLKGFLIYDHKKGKTFYKSKAKLENPKTKREIRKLIRNKDHIFLDVIEVKSLFRRINNQNIEFCTNDKKEKYIRDKYRLLFNRFLVFEIEGESFIIVKADNNEVFITFQCW